MPEIRGSVLGDVFTSTEVEGEVFYGRRGGDTLLFNGDMTDRFFGGRGQDTFVWNTRRPYEGESSAEGFEFVDFAGGRGLDTVEFRLEVAADVMDIDLAAFHARFSGAEVAAVNLSFQSSQADTPPRDFSVEGTMSADSVLVHNRVGENLTILTRAGRDTVTIANSSQTEELLVKTGWGNDIVRNLAGTDDSQIFTGRGRDKVMVDGETSGFYHLGRGRDLITFSYSTKFAPDTVHTGKGRDVIEFTSYPTGLSAAHILDFDTARDRIRLDFETFGGDIFFAWDNEGAEEGDAELSISESGDAVYVDGVQFLSFEQPVELTEDNFLFV
ncbi:hypothetical protein [Leisingera sp. S232]|uniref:hypothetical protein n=1 Tax=Leisingera sp. S232 TaxID=3415132 RepID=UPI003C7D16E8